MTFRSILFGLLLGWFVTGGLAPLRAPWDSVLFVSLACVSMFLWPQLERVAGKVGGRAGADAAREQASSLAAVPAAARGVADKPVA